MGSLLGKPKSQTSKSSSKTSTVVTLPSYLQGPIQDLVGKTSSLLNKPFTPYTGDRVAGLTQDEQNAFDLVRTMLSEQGALNLDPSQEITTEVANRGLNGFSQDVIDQYMNPYQTNVMDISRGRQLDQFELAKRDLQQRQGSTGAFGGSRSGLQSAQTYKDFARQLAETEATQLYQGYNDSMNRAFQGTQMAGQASTDLANMTNMERVGQYRDATALEGIGRTQRGINQAGLDATYGEFIREQAYPWEQLSAGSNVLLNTANLMRGSSGTSSTTNTQSSSGGSGLLSAAIGLGSMALGVPGVGSLAAGGLGSALSGLGMGGGMASALNSTFGGGVTSSFMQPFWSNGSIPNTPQYGAGGNRLYGPGFNKGGVVKGYNEGGNTLASKLASWAEWFKGQEAEQNAEIDSMPLANVPVPLLPASANFTGGVPYPEIKPLTPEDEARALIAAVDAMSSNRQPLAKDSVPLREADGLGFLNVLRNKGTDEEQGMLQQIMLALDEGKGYAEGGMLTADFNTILSYLNNLKPKNTAPGATRGERLMTTVGNIPAGLVSALKAPYNYGMSAINRAADYINTPVFDSSQATAPGVEAAANTPAKMRALYDAQERLLDSESLKQGRDIRGNLKPRMQQTPVTDDRAGIKNLINRLTSQNMSRDQVKEILNPTKQAPAQEAPAAKPESKWNLPLIAFGASLLEGNENRFLSDFGRGANAFITTKEAQKAQDKADLAAQAAAELEARKAAVMMYNAETNRLNATKPMDPSVVEKNAAMAAYYRNGGGRSAGGGDGQFAKLATTIYGDLMSSGIGQDEGQAWEIAQQRARELVGGGGGMQSAITETDLTGEVDYDTLANEIMSSGIDQTEFDQMDPMVQQHLIARLARQKELEAANYYDQ